MDKIEIITPVHIATGDTIQAPCFYRFGNSTIAKRYDFSDILSQMPAHVLTDSVFLQSLASSSKKKGSLYKNIHSYVNYSKLQCLYSVFDDNELDIAESGYDVSEQIKDLDKPYIPGSSIKGALLNAWNYFLIKKNYKENVISTIFSLIRNKQLKEENCTILNYLFGDTLDYSNFMKELQSCLVCSDLLYDKMEILYSERIGSSSRNGDGSIPGGYKECIQSNQSIEGMVFQIDEKKKKRLEVLLDTNPKLFIPKNDMGPERTIHRFKLLLKQFTKASFVAAANDFTKDVLAADESSETVRLFDDFGYNEVVKSNLALEEEITKSIMSKKKAYYLRIGNSTNYFSKSIALLIKMKSKHLYEEYFDSVLSPNSNIKSKQRANKKNTPKTRVVYSSYEHSYLPGYIKVQYD